jgi:predicted PurR-regulated permease PerM
VNDREPVVVPRSQVTVKTVLTISATVVGVVAAVFLLLHSFVTLTVTVVAVLLAVALHHAVDRLGRWGVPRPLSISLVLGVSLGSLVGGLVLIVPSLVAQVRALADNLPGYVERIRHHPLFLWADTWTHLGQRLDSLQRGDTEVLGGSSMDPMLRMAGSVMSALGATVTLVFLVIFMLIYGGPLVRGLLAESLPAHRERYERVLNKVYCSVGGYISGLTLIAVVNAVCASTFLAILGVPYFLPLGLLSGLGSLIPLLGATVSGVVLGLVALGSGGVWMGMTVVAYATLYQLFENHALAPVIYKRTVDLNPLVTLLGLVLFVELAGILGAFLAVPLVGAAQIVVRELLLLRRERLGLPLQGDVAEQLRKRGPWRPAFWRRPRHV